MILYPPMVITSRLLPGIHVRNPKGLAEVSVEALVTHSRDKPRWRCFIDLPDGTSHVDDTLAGWGDARGMLAVVCSFLSACAEARRYSRGREPSENADLWPEAVGTWAESVSDELSMIEFELAQGGDR